MANKLSSRIMEKILGKSKKTSEKTPAAKPTGKQAKPAAKPAQALKAAKPQAKVTKPAQPPKAAQAAKSKPQAKTAQQPAPKAQATSKTSAPAKPQTPTATKSAAPATKAAASAKKGRGKNAASREGICREIACELSATTGPYCRMHYIKNWKKIKRKELILKERKLNRYIEELVSKYPDKYIEAIRQDLASEKDFAKVITDLEIEEPVDDFEVETDSNENLIENIKREVEDEGDIF